MLIKVTINSSRCRPYPLLLPCCPRPRACLDVRADRHARLLHIAAALQSMSRGTGAEQSGPGQHVPLSATPESLSLARLT